LAFEPKKAPMQAIVISQAHLYSDSNSVSKNLKKDLPGAKVVGNPNGDPTYYITNNSSHATIDANNVQLLADVPEQSLSSLLDQLNPNTSPDFGTPIGSFSIGPGGSSSPISIPTLNVGDFFYVRGSVGNGGSFLYGYGVVPEPSSLTLLLIGAIAVLGHRQVRRLRRDSTGARALRQ
jgi:hypothetical protein